MGVTALVEPEVIRYDRGLIGPPIRQGRLADGDDEVVLGQATAAALGVEVGDRVTVKRDGGKDVDFDVVGCRRHLRGQRRPGLPHRGDRDRAAGRAVPGRGRQGQGAMG
jgi:hypothetical protein